MFKITETFRKDDNALELFKKVVDTAKALNLVDLLNKYVKSVLIKN